MIIDKVSEFETYLRQNIMDCRFIECEDNSLYKLLFDELNKMKERFYFR